MSRHLINQYYKDLDNLIRYGGSKNENAIRPAFERLLNSYCQSRGFLLVNELYIKSKINTDIRLDGIVKDALRLDWGYWEAKDTKNSLDKEIEDKLAKGYPSDNLLFEDSNTAVLYQNGNEVMRVSMKDINPLDNILNLFLDYERPEVRDFRKAITSFNQDLPTIIDTLRNLINQQSPSSLTSITSPPNPSPFRRGELENERNKKFIQARDKFLKVCQESINSEINIDDIREMIIQHILTEDIFNNIFSESQFHQENNIAHQLQEVIKTFFTGNIKRNILKTIENYYSVIIRTASSIVNHQEKQKFLKVVYENFYKAYNPKAADRLGIVYTPNEIVKFMVESTDYLLNKHFNKLLGDKGVEILDPATGTGTFITEILDYLLTSDIEYKYQNEIHCNEVSILPYYIANLNIEYTYQQKMGKYLEFNNICLVDTLDHTSFVGKQMDLFAMNQENTARIKRQNDRKISVIIGNPPYNAKQENFNDNNANRAYKNIDKRIKETYIKEGTAQNQIVVYDMYTRFMRWATDRLNNDGIIAFITNSSLIDARAFDGFRKVLEQEFSYIYIIDLGGNIRAGDNTGNVFNIMVGVAITFLVRKSQKDLTTCQIYYQRLTESNGKDKLNFLGKNKLQDIEFTRIIPDKKYNWINQTDNDFEELLPLIDKEVKSGKSEEAIFKLFTRGVETTRDEWVYDLDDKNLTDKVRFCIHTYNQSIKENNKDFRIKWSSSLEAYLKNKIQANFDSFLIQNSLYRPFISMYHYTEKLFNHRLTQNHYEMFSNNLKEDNLLIAISGIGFNKPFQCLASNLLIGLDTLEKTQCLPLYTYDKNGNQIENITDWGLKKFREYYASPPQPSQGQVFYIKGIMG